MERVFFDELCQNAVDIQNAQSFEEIYPRFVSCLSEKLTDVQIDDVRSGSMTITPNVGFSTEKVKNTRSLIKILVFPSRVNILIFC